MRDSEKLRERGCECDSVLRASVCVCVCVCVTRAALRVSADPTSRLLQGDMGVMYGSCSLSEESHDNVAAGKGGAWDWHTQYIVQDDGR